MASTSTSGQANGRAGGPSGSELPSLPSLLTSSQGRTRMLFEGNASPLGYGHASTSAAAALGGVDAYETTTKARLAAKMGSEYKDARLLPQVLLAQQAAMGPARPGQQPAATSTTASLAGQKRKTPASTLTESYIDELEGGGKPARGIVDASESNGHLSGTSGGTSGGGGGGAGALALRPQQSSRNVPTATPNGNGSLLSTALIRKKEAASRIAKPDYHAQWKLSRVISGHLGWVRAIAVEPQNKWFATGAGDRMIKVRLTTSAWPLTRSPSLTTALCLHILPSVLLSPDLGPGIRRAENLLDWAHFYCARSGGVFAASISLFLRGGQTDQVLGPGKQSGHSAIHRPYIRHLLLVAAPNP